MESRRFFKPTHLVLGPGGSKGFYFLGLLHQLSICDYLSDIIGYSGCSVGAMISLMLSCGYRPVEILTLACQINLFKDFFNVPIITKLGEIKKSRGVVSASILAETLSNAVFRKFGFIPTMRQLFELKNVTFQTVTFDDSTKSPLYINHINLPDTNIVTATILSINIPLVFQKLIYDGHEFVDGAFCDSLPIFPFDDGINKVLAVYVNTRTQKTQFFVSSIASSIHTMLTTSVCQYRESIIAFSSQRCEFIELNSHITDTAGITLKPKDKASMVLYGVKAAKEYLKKPVEEVGPDLEGSNSIKFQCLKSTFSTRIFKLGT